MELNAVDNISKEISKNCRNKKERFVSVCFFKIFGIACQKFERRNSRLRISVIGIWYSYNTV